MKSLLKRLGLAAAMAATLGLAACSDSSSTTTPLPTATTYTVGGTVTGLPSGNQVGLLNNAGDALSVTQDGAFTFATPVASGGAYAVTVGTQPTGATCAVTTAGASGTVADANITAVAVTCTPSFRVGGTVSGLATGASVALGGSTAGTATVTANGAFTLPTGLATGAAYTVSVTTQPAGQFCAIDNATGTIAAAAVTNVTVSCGAATAYAYVTNQSDSTISTYSIAGSNQAVAAVSGTTATGTGPFAMATNTAGTFAVVANALDSTLKVYGINASTGALTAVGTATPVQDLLSPRSVAIAGNLVFVVASDLATINRLLSYSVDTTTGVLTALDSQVLPAGVTPGYATSVAVNGNGSLVMATISGPNTLSVYSVNQGSGVLTAVGTPVVTGTNPQSVKFHPNGNLALVANADTNDIAVYVVDAAGALTAAAGSPFATGGTGASAMALDPVGNVVLVSNSGSNNVSAFTIDASTGAMAATTGSPFAAGTGPGSVAIDRSGLLAFVGNRGDATLSVFRVAVGGALTAVTGSPFATGAQPSAIAFGP